MIGILATVRDLSAESCRDAEGHVFSYTGQPSRDDLEYATRIIETPAKCSKCGATGVIVEKYPHIPIRT